MDPLRPGDPHQVGPYRLTGRLGEGGMGQVFLGRCAAGREVAVKLIRPEHAGNRQFRTRFAREVAAARRVSALHTAPVLDADPDADPPWMATAYISGPSLQQAVAGRGPLSAEEVRTLGTGLAEGLAAIHACGLVHRDIKPGNVILAADRPRIIDFGIARALDASAVTATGAVLGTYSYMSPEQIRGQRAGPASDVFSLGSVLAFAATGQSPFAADSIPAIVHRITSGQPDLRDVPHEHGLHDLIKACLAKDPGDRPGIPQLSTRLTWSQPPTRNHLRRRIVLLGGFTAISGAAAPAVWSLFDSKERPAVNPLLATYAATGDITSLAFSLNGKRLACGGTDPQLRDPATGRTTARLRGHTSAVYAVAFSPNGTTLATGGDYTLRLWDPTTGRNTATVRGHTYYVESVAFSPNGKTLATGGADNAVRLWNATTRQNIATLTSHTGTIWSVAYSPDGKTLATASNDTTVRLWNVSTRSSTILRAHTGPIRAVAFSPDGKTLATAGNDETVRLWNTATHRNTATLTGHGHWVFALAFSPDGKTLGSGGGDNTVRLWETATGRALKVFRGHTDAVSAIAFNPDRRTLVSGGKDTTIRIWHLP